MTEEQKRAQYLFYFYGKDIAIDHAEYALSICEKIESKTFWELVITELKTKVWPKEHLWQEITGVGSVENQNINKGQ